MKLKYPLEKNRVMSKFFLIASVLLIISCQKSNEDKAKDLIRQYIKENANDPESYESVEFRKIDTVFTSYLDDSIYNDLETRRFSSNLTNEDDRYKYMDSMNQVLLDYKKAYKPKPHKLMVLHKYRAKNGFGAKVLSSTIFYFDKDLTKIDSVENF